MKKNTIITALVLLVAVPMFAERVTPEAARIAATTFMNNNGTKAVELTDISKEAGFPNLYIFTAEKGFVVMAADDCVQPVLGYSLTGTFVTENMPDNVKGWLQGYSDEIQYSIDNQLKASSETAQQWKDLCSGNPNMPKATTVVTPLLQTQWNQGNPYNLLCPSNSVTGCVATAMAQVMKYWNYPAHGIGWHSYIPGTHPEYGELYAEYNSTNYDWNNMTNTYGSSSTDAQKQAVATLMYHCGVSVDMDYSPSSSGAVTSYVADALKLYFNYSSEAQHLSRSAYSESDWINMLKADLNQNRPIQYHGNGSGGGHSFVCDGYDSDNYFHFNWGWGGYCDAYYSINNLNPGPGGIGSGSNGIYNNNQGAIFGVHPSDCTASAPNNLTCTQNGRNLTLQWTAASGAASYNIYCNMSLVGNVTTNSFAYTAPFGSSRYYVRSVDANGELSLSTNMVTVTVDYQMPVVDDLAASVSGSNVSLSWTAPEWCYPETPSATLTYGNGNYTGSSLGYHDGTTTMYWGHKYPASSLSTYSNMVVYKVSFYAKYTGSYKVYVYQGTTSDHPQTG